MKKAFFLCAFFLISILAFSQAKPVPVKETPKTDTAKGPVLTDNTPLIPLAYLQQFDKYLQDKFTVAQYNVIMDGLKQVVQVAIDDWNRKNPALKQK